MDPSVDLRRVVRHGDLDGLDARRDLYYLVPSLGPTYAYPQWFDSLSHTPNTSVRDALLADRVEVLAGPWDTHTVQTIAAFASLHVAVMVSLCLVVEAMRLPGLVRMAAWGFLALTEAGDGLPRLALLRGHPRRGRRRRRGGGDRGQGDRHRPRRRAELWTFRSAPHSTAAPAGSRSLATLLLSPTARAHGAEAFGVVLRLASGVLRAGPEEPAQPVALGAWDDVEVQVRHRLADGVVDRDERALGAESLRDPRPRSAARPRGRGRGARPGRSGSVSTC